MADNEIKTAQEQEQVNTQETEVQINTQETEVQTSQFSTQPSTAQKEEVKTFTQEEINRIVEERLKREREKYKDYSELKKLAEEYKKIQEEKMSEQEKLQAKLSELERNLLEKEREAAELNLELLKIKVLDEMGLPKSWAKRIFGTNEEEIRQDAEELKKLLPTQTQQKQQIGTGSNPASVSSLTPDLDKLGRLPIEEYIKIRKSGG